MKKDKKKTKKNIKKWIFILSLVGSPIFIAVLFFFGMITIFMTVFAEDDEVQINSYCNPTGEYDYTAINHVFSSYYVTDEKKNRTLANPVGLLTDEQHLFIKYAEKYKVDAVFIMAIALRETKEGTAPLLYSNYNLSPTFLGEKAKYNSLEKGVEALFKAVKERMGKSGKKTTIELSEIFSDINVNKKELESEWLNAITINILNLGGVVDCDVLDRGNGGTVVLGEGEYVIPTFNNFRITSAFGYRIHPITREEDFHSGLDLSCSMASPILAFTDGSVIYVEDKPSGWSTTLGNYIIIQHDNGLTTWYGHLHPNTTLVSKGDRVMAGQQIGGCGTTGASTGYHLDFKVRLGKQYFDPYPYLIGAKNLKDF